MITLSVGDACTSHVGFEANVKTTGIYRQTPVYRFYRDRIQFWRETEAKSNMGIDGLLRQLKGAVQESHLRSYSGKCVVVDAFSWLHKACYGSAFELATGKETDAYVRYMLRKVDLLHTCGITDVVLVFDGDRLPLKASTHSKRSENKTENRELAFQHMADSKRLNGSARQDEVAKAYQHFQRAVSITPQVVNTVMQALRQARIPFIVAPFEADAQMVWMCKAGMASAIITEDSDVLVYCLAANVNCHVLFKLDEGGMVQALSREILHKATASTDNPFLKKIHFLTTGEKDATRMFVQFCALAGCDFLDSLPNMGIVTALKHIYSFRGAPANVRVQRLLAKLGSNGSKIPPTFYAQFQKSESIFFHHIIFNVNAQRCEFLIDDGHSNCHADIFARVKESFGVRIAGECLHSVKKPSTKSYLGDIPSRETMLAIYKGELCSRTKQRITEEPSSVETTGFEPFEHSAPQSNGDGMALSPPASPVPRNPAPRKPAAVDPVNEERRQVQQEQQRNATLSSLLNAYSASSSRPTSAAIDTPPLSQSSQPAAHTTASNVSLKRSNGEVTAVPATVFSMKELTQRHARSEPTATTASARQSPFFKALAAPVAVKKRRLDAPPLGKSATLHQFFNTR